MSKRGTPMGGRYKGIYRKEIGGTTVYTVVVSEVRRGKRRYVTRRTKSLTHAAQLKQQLEAKKTLKQLPGWDDAPTLGQLVEDHFIPMVSQTKWPAEPIRYLKELVKFFGFDRRLKEITSARVLEYRNHLKHQRCGGLRRGKLNPRSRDHRLAMLKRILVEAKEAGYISIVPKVSKFGGVGVRVSTLTLDQFEAILRLMPEPPMPHRAILLMGLATGQRRTDLLNMTRSQIKDGFIEFKSSKTGKVLFADYPPPLQTAVEAIKPNDTIWLFPNPKTKRPYTDLKKPLTTACDALGIKRITLHDLRRLCADRVSLLTKDARVVMTYMGWSSMQMVNRYTNLNNARLGIAGNILGQLNSIAVESK